MGTAAFGAFAATGVAQIVLGGVQTFISDDMGWDRSTIAYAVTAGTWVSGLLTPFVGRLTDRYGPRGLMPIGLIVVGICLFGLAGIKSTWHFYAAYIIARSVANPILIGVVPRTTVVNFFEKRRNLALGFQSTARPIAGAINIQIISIAAQRYSWRVGYRALGIYALALIIPILVVMRRRPEDIGLRPDGAQLTALGSTSIKDSPSSALLTQDWEPSKAIGTSTFWLIAAAEALIIVTAGAIGFQVVPYLKDLGLSQNYSAIALSLASLLGAVGNPVWGLLADQLSPRRMALIISSVTTLVTCLFLITESTQIGFVIIVVWGIASGGLTIVGNMMLAEYFGRLSFGAISGMMGPIQLGFLGLGPSLGAILFNYSNGYTALFALSVSAYSIATFLIYTSKRPIRSI